MGIIVSKNNEENSRLNERITADLRERAQKTALGSDPDLVEDSDYARDLKKTSKYGWILPVLLVIGVIALVVVALV